VRVTRSGFACVALLVLLPAGLLWPSLAAGEVFLPFSAATFPPFAAELDAPEREALERGANLDITEVTLTFCPEWRFARSELAAGRLPHWNPYARFGASLLATSVVGLLYPPNWLTFLALDPERGLAWNAFGTLVGAGLLMLCFLRALGLNSGAALFGAVAFAWSGTLSANLHFYQRMHALIWLPGMLWAMLAMQRGTGRSRRRAGVALAACVALSWLAGFPAYAAAATLVAGAYGIWLCGGYALAVGRAPALRLAGGMAGSAALGGLVACVQVLPMLAFFPDSNRAPDPGHDAIAAQAFDPMGFLGYLLPHAFGQSALGGPPYPSSLLAWLLFSRASWDNGIPFAPNYNYIEYAVFPGTLVLWLAVFGLVAGRTRARWFLAPTLALLWVLATAGSWTGAANDLPFVRSVPPMRFVGPACALVAWLAAVGADRAVREPLRRPWYLLAGVASGLALACAVGWTLLRQESAQAWLARATPVLLAHYRPRFPHATAEVVQGLFGAHVDAAQQRLAGDLAYGAVACVLAAAWLFAMGRAHARAGMRAALIAIGLCATTLELFALAWPINRSRPAAALSAPALDVLRAGREEHRRGGGRAVIRATTDVDPLPRALPPGLLVPERIRDLHAYTFVDARSHRLFAALCGRDRMLREYWPGALPDDERLRRPVWDALGVGYVLSTMPLHDAGEPAVLRPGRGEFHVYTRPTALPRAFVVPALREVQDEDAAVAAMIEPSFAPRAEVIVTPDQAAALRGASVEAGAESRTVTFRVDDPAEVVLDVSAGPAGLLVMSDALMRGWTATVDGVDAPIRRGDLFMRVVPVPARAVEVRFRFTTPRLAVGAMLGAAALLVLVWQWCRRGSARA